MYENNVDEIDSEKGKRGMDNKILDELRNKIINFTGLRDYLSKVENGKNIIEVDVVNHFLFQRISSIINQAECYIFEDEYVERAWKDMIALHYINTTYSIRPHVARVHFFTSNSEINQEHYLGFITIRPIPEGSMMLSFVFPNFDVYKISNDKANCLSIYKVVHIAYEDETLEFNIRTFPFFAQDGSVAVCAHADILMVAMYLNAKFGYKMIQLSEMQMFSHVCAFPSDGLNYQELLKIFDANRIPARVYELTNGTRSKYLIKTFVESNFPVLLICANHTVCIIGTQQTDEDFSFIVYDDSGFFTRNNNCPGSFVKSFSWNDLQKFMSFTQNDEELLEKTQEQVCTGGTILTLVPERAYLSYMDVERNIVRFCKDVLIGKKFSPSKFYELKPEFLLVEQSELKKFIKEHEQEVLISSENRNQYLSQLYKAHYAWICWFSFNQNAKCLIIQDPTKVPQTLKYPIYLLFDGNVEFSSFKHLTKVEGMIDNE